MALGRFGAIALLTVGGMLLKKTLGSQQQRTAAPGRVPMGRTGEVGMTASYGGCNSELHRCDGVRRYLVGARGLFKGEFVATRGWSRPA